MAVESTNIYAPSLPAGPYAASAAGQHTARGEKPHLTLAAGDGGALVNLIDTANISPAARVAAAIGQRVTELTNSPNGPAGMPGIHPVINGIAELGKFAKDIAGQ